MSNEENGIKEEAPSGALPPAPPVKESAGPAPVNEVVPPSPREEAPPPAREENGGSSEAARPCALSQQQPAPENLEEQRRDQYPGADAVVARDPEPAPAEDGGEDFEDDPDDESGGEESEAGEPMDAAAGPGPAGSPPAPTSSAAPSQRPPGRHRRRGRGRGGQDGGGNAHRPEQERRRDDQHRAGQDRGRQDRGRQERGGHEREYRSDQRGPGPSVKREILSNTSFEETRIAIMENGRLAELLWERKSAQNIVGNIYKGVVENVLPGISSAFVNIGYEKNAYLYISDVLGERGAAIDATLKKGQDIMIQVAKEAIGTKGMKVTMDVSLPGRFLVFTPRQGYVGISKHIGDPQERERLSAIVDRLVAEELGGKGVVVRTEAEGATEAELEREVKYLLQTWNQIQKKFEAGPSPALLHKDLDLPLQVARDILSDKVYVYLLDNKENYKNVQEFIEAISPELKDRVRYYDAKTPIFKAFNLEGEIENLRRTKVLLPNGGSIIIQEAESLCAIDVNTGRFTGSKSQEETVTQTNVEAAAETAHQLRLRNIGGIIVVDFIDMRKASNRQKVMEAFAQACRGDRAKIRILPITRLGLVELTRERKRESTVSLITEECPQCKGAGRVLSGETLRIRIQLEIQTLTGGRPGGHVRLNLHPVLAEQFRAQQSVIEKNIQRSIKIQSDPQLPWEEYRIILE